jgi:hypothetical protein
MDTAALLIWFISPYFPKRENYALPDKLSSQNQLTASRHLTHGKILTYNPFAPCF